MDSARWERIQTIFHEAVGLPEAARKDYLQTTCAGDAAMMAEVLTMLTADAGGASLLDRGLPEVAYQIVGTPVEQVSPQEFGPYRLIRVLGEGGMGVVWLAERADTGNVVAIKFLPHAGLSPARRERFAREIKTLAKLKHPFIARLYDAGALADGTPWFVMEYVEGMRLSEYCREQGRTMEEQIRLFRSVCEAVQYAHGQEIIHRDLKPSNILVESDGTPRLLDFGIARELQSLDEPADRTKAGLRFISPDYAAPEWVREGAVGFYTDVYSLGVMLYEMLTGRLPFERSKRWPSEADNDRADRDPEKPSVVCGRLTDGQPGSAQLPLLDQAAWSDLDVLCLKAMNKDAHERYQSVEALIRDLDHYLKHEPLEARPGIFQYRLNKFVKRNRRSVLAASLVFTLVAALVIFFTLRLAKARNAALAEAARTERIQHFMLNLFEGGDKEAGPAEELRVVTLIDRGVPEAQSLRNEPEVQADLYQTLGTMYQKLGKLDRADALLHLSLKERESLTEPNKSRTADNLIALGLLRSDQGRSKEAEPMVREALGLINAHDPRNRPLLAKATSALGYVLVESGEYGPAIDTLNQGVSLQTAANPLSPELAATLSKLADAHLYLGHYSIADSLYQRAMAIDQHVYGNDHPRVSEDLRNLAEIQETWGHYAEAERYERQSLHIAQVWYGADHPDTAEKMTTLASTLIYEGQYREADELLQKALAVQQSVYGNMHPRVAYVLNLLGSVANHQRDFKDAEADDLRVADIYRSAYGDSDYRVAIAMANLASVYFKEEHYDQAEQMFRDVVVRETKALSADNINTGITEIKLGRTLLLERRYQEAERYTRTGYEVLLKQTSPATSFIQGARQDLVAIYAALNQPQEAQRFKDELASANISEARVASPK